MFKNCIQYKKPEENSSPGLNIYHLPKAEINIQEFENTVNKDPLVSVCIQTYQHGKYIAKCLDSILMQKTTFLFEIIVGEDK